MKRKLPFLIILFASINLFALERKNLSQCVRIALENNPELKISGIDFQQAVEDEYQAKKKFLPTFDFATTYRRQSSIPEIDISKILNSGNGLPGLTLPGDGITLGSLDVYDLKLTLSQPIYTGSRLRNGKIAAQNLMESKKYERIQQRSQLIYNVVASYGQVLKAHKIFQIARTSQGQIKAHLRDISNLVEQGLARKDERMQVEVRLSEAELGILQAQNAVRLTIARLESVMNEDLQSGVRFDSFPLLRKNVDTDSSVNLAYSERFELKSLTFATRSAEASERMAKGEKLPSIAAFISLGYGKPGLNFVDDKWMDYWVAGLGVQWDFWNWGTSSSKVRKAQLEVKKITEYIDQVKNMIRLDVTQSCLVVQENLTRLDLTNNLARQATETFRVKKTLYTKGQVNASELLDAQSELTRARLQVAQAEIDYFVSFADWHRSVGGNVEQIK